MELWRVGWRRRGLNTEERPSSLPEDQFAMLGLMPMAKGIGSLGVCLSYKVAIFQEELGVLLELQLIFR